MRSTKGPLISFERAERFPFPDHRVFAAAQDLAIWERNVEVIRSG